MHGTVLVERPARGWKVLKIKNLQTPAKRGMKAFDGPPKKQFRGPGLILLFVGEVAGVNRPDEHSRDGVLTSGFQTALPPSQFRGTSGFGSL